MKTENSKANNKHMDGHVCNCETHSVSHESEKKESAVSCGCGDAHSHEGYHHEGHVCGCDHHHEGHLKV